MTVRIEATGQTVADALAIFGANLESAETDALIAELRQRLATENPPQVLRIIPFAEAHNDRRRKASV